MATLADSIFIGDFDFNSKYILPVLKASSGKWAKIIFPYNTKNFQIISDSELKQQLEIFEHLSFLRKNFKNVVLTIPIRIFDIVLVEDKLFQTLIKKDWL
ncbi:hypothetical protein [Mesomycoplasma ovipneumoniae]|uniref:hypothetical protein n=1 Tax=Mesomycoplasma ovipneumoniae TaxID=29562 RepID=UPI00311AEF45